MAVWLSALTYYRIKYKSQFPWVYVAATSARAGGTWDTSRSVGLRSPMLGWLWSSRGVGLDANLPAVEVASRLYVNLYEIQAAPNAKQ